MKRASFLLAAVAVCVLCSSAQALWSVFDKGAWPQSWPQELEPLRKQSGTIQGGMIDIPIHHIPFTKREEFEAAWPHILKVKSKGAPIVLLRSPSNHWFFKNTKAGVLVHCPPGPAIDPAKPAVPLKGVDNLPERWLYSNYIELVVDGEIVDLNRIQLPADTPIIDQRFEAEPKK